MKTHNIKDLNKLVSSINKEVGQFLKPAVALSKYYLAYRYPDAIEIEEITQSKVEEAFSIAEKVYTELKKQIPEE